MTRLQFYVPGTPRPQGSKRPFRNQHTGRIQQVESSTKVKPWRADVRAAAQEAIEGDPDAYLPLWDQPLHVAMNFYFLRPKAHYGTGKNEGLLKQSAPEHYAQTPDIEKLARAVADALTGIVYADDRRITQLTLFKGWTTNHPGAEITINQI